VAAEWVEAAELAWAVREREEPHREREEPHRERAEPRREREEPHREPAEPHQEPVEPRREPAEPHREQAEQAESVVVRQLVEEREPVAEGWPAVRAEVLRVRPAVTPAQRAPMAETAATAWEAPLARAVTPVPAEAPLEALLAAADRAELRQEEPPAKLEWPAKAAKPIRAVAVRAVAPMKTRAAVARCPGARGDPCSPRSRSRCSPSVARFAGPEPSPRSGGPQDSGGASG
jgi:hypothetical protein